MQKKVVSNEHSSNWEENLKKQQRSEMLKKVLLWGGVILICIVVLAILVQMANKNTPTATPVENTKLKPVSSNDIVLGNPDAKVVLYVYADFQCPACAAFSPLVNQALAEYDGKVKVVYRYFPLRSIHKNAVISGQASYAAWKLGNFKDMKDLLYDNQAKWENEKDPRSIFIEYAKKIGLDTAKFEEMMNSDEAKNAVLAGETDAISLGLNSTPSFFIGNKQFTPNGADGIKNAIEAELKGTDQAPTNTPLR